MDCWQGSGYLFFSWKMETSSIWDQYSSMAVVHSKRTAAGHFCQGQVLAGLPIPTQPTSLSHPASLPPVTFGFATSGFATSTLLQLSSANTNVW